MAQTIKLVFSNPLYLTASLTIFLFMLLVLLVSSEYVFLEPYVVSHLPPGTEIGLLLIVTLSALSALVIPMNLFRISILKRSKQKMSGSILGSVAGSIAGACSCGPVGFAVISTFGSIGATATAFLTNYETPIRLAAVAVLTVTYFTTVKSLKIECKINS